MKNYKPFPSPANQEITRSPPLPFRNNPPRQPIFNKPPPPNPRDYKDYRTNQDSTYLRMSPVEPLEKRREEATETMNKLDRALTAVFKTGQISSAVRVAPGSLPTTSSSTYSSRPTLFPGTFLKNKVKVKSCAVKLFLLIMSASWIPPNQGCYPPRKKGLVPCRLTISQANLDKATSDIEELSKKVSDLRVSPVENPDGMFGDQIVKLFPFKATSDISKVQDKCNQNGRVFAPKSEHEIAHILALTKDSILVGIEKSGANYILTNTHLRAPQSTHPIPENAKYILFQKKETVDVLYISASSEMDASKDYYIPCIFSPNDPAAKLTLEHAQTELLFQSASALASLKELSSNYSTPAPPDEKEEKCVPINILPYTSDYADFPTFGKFITPNTKEDAFQNINKSTSLFEELKKRAMSLIEARFSVNRSNSKLQDIIINFNTSRVESITILVLMIITIVLIITLICVSGICQLIRGRSARNVLQAAGPLKIRTRPRRSRSRVRSKA